MWYNSLSEYLLKNDIKIILCVDVYSIENPMIYSLVVYVDEMNLIGTPEDFLKTDEY